ncbi:hypothetical protein VPH35_096627 [Triticum aestivum]
MACSHRHARPVPCSSPPHPRPPPPRGGRLRFGAQVLPPRHLRPQLRRPVRRGRDLDWGATEMRKDKARIAPVRVNEYEHHNPLRGCWLIRIPNSQTSMLRCSRYGSSSTSSTTRFFWFMFNGRRIV